MFAFIKKIVFAVVLAVVVLFAYQNLAPLSQSIQFQFDLYAPGWKATTPEFPVVFLLIVFFLVGMILTGFHGVYERVARRSEIRRRDRRIRELEAETDGLRARLGELRPPPVPATRSDPGPERVVTPSLESTPVSTPVEKPGPVLPLEDEPTL